MMTWVPLHLPGNLQGNLLVQGSSDDGRRPPAVQGGSASRSHISNNSRKILEFKFGNFRDAPGSGFYALRCRVLGFNRNCIGFVSGVLSCFGGVLFFAFVVMVWVLSGVVGGGWFWGAEGLGLKGWGFGGFSRMPVVVVPWWWSVVPWCSSWWSHNVAVVPWWWCSFGSGGLSWWWRCPWVMVVVPGGRRGGPVVVVPWWWPGGGGPWRWSAVVVSWWWFRGGGLVVVVSWWWSRGGGPVVVVPWWWSVGPWWWSVAGVCAGGCVGGRGGGLVVVVLWWWSRGGGLVVVVSWWWSRGGGPWFGIFF